MNNPKAIPAFRFQSRRDSSDGDHLKRSGSLLDTAADGIPRLPSDVTTMLKEKQAAFLARTDK
jgi:hypothetical protein